MSCIHYRRDGELVVRVVGTARICRICLLDVPPKKKEQ